MILEANTGEFNFNKVKVVRILHPQIKRNQFDTYMYIHFNTKN